MHMFGQQIEEGKNEQSLFYRHCPWFLACNGLALRGVSTFPGINLFIEMTELSDTSLHISYCNISVSFSVVQNIHSSYGLLKQITQQLFKCTANINNTLLISFIHSFNFSTTLHASHAVFP